MKNDDKMVTINTNKKERLEKEDDREESISRYTDGIIDLKDLQRKTEPNTNNKIKTLFGEEIDYWTVLWSIKFDLELIKYDLEMAIKKGIVNEVMTKNIEDAIKNVKILEENLVRFEVEKKMKE
ncbi:MAG: hypothetical protein QXU98_12690 [Candidatus Parvarchaeota archaeon]